MDESLSSVDQFLRDNGFSISGPALGGLASLSGDELLDDDLLLSDADERQAPRATRDGESPRFVLLEDADLLLTEDREQDADAQRLSGDRTSERREDEEGARSWKEQDETQDENQEQDESLDRSMLFGGSEFSPLSSHNPPMGDIRAVETLSAPPSSSSSSSLYQLTPQREEVERAAMVSAASSTSLPSSPAHSLSSGRVLDEELNDALGVPKSAVGGGGRSTSSSRSGAQRKSAGNGSEQQSRTSRTSTTQRALFTEASGEERSMDGSIHDERGGAWGSSDGSRWSQPRSDSERHLSFQEADEKKEEDNDNGSVGNVAAESGRESGAGSDEGAWDGLNDLLRRNGLPAVRFRRVASGDILPDRESLFNVIHDFGVQLERKNETIQDLVLASKRNSRVRSRREGELQTVEKKNEDTQKALEKAKAEIQRLKALQKKESDSAELLSKKLKNSCLRLQQQLKVSEHRVKAKEVIVERMQAKLQQQVDKENMNKTRDRRAFRNLQDRDPRRANPRDIQALDTIGVYEAQREQMQEEIEHFKSQVAALNSELRDKDNSLARQGSAALQKEPPIWEQHSDEGRGSGSQYRPRYHPGSSSVASDEMMLEQLETARREQEVAAAKLRHREAAMIKKVAMIEQELLVARETIAEMREENANLTLEAESRPSIRDYRLSQRRIHQLERQVAENKLALEEASDLNELRKYMGTKELVERDRLNHRLHLNRLNTLPRETTLEVVKHVCRVLHLTDITLIAPSLDKLCSVVAAVPRMEKFIRDVCGFVFLNLNDNTEGKGADSARFELEQVLPTLQKWMVERRTLHALEGFKASIITELCKRTVEPSILNNQEDSSRDESPPSHPSTLARAVYIVSELVELEKSVIHHREIYTQAAAEVERRPNVLINQIVRHFSHLFQVKSIDGVLPKINETYLQVNEMKNFLHTIRDILHLKNDTSLVHCLNAIKERLQEDAAGPARVRQSGTPEGGDTEQENAYGGNTPIFVVEKLRSQSNAPGGSVEPDLVGVRQVRQMSILVRELKRELGAGTMEEILPRTKRLMELLSLSIHNADPEDEEEDE
ncbi:hypothetical protein PHYPSEUDO_011180 [Phytophthora pseudosyringae]|uniref:Centrosomal protein of 70 kDa n=1 Tax=Phytophthora pseudosyringae TaxID=221518 RepID=A0A8T1VC44_9STRA|nr:hypothetical protein PHYPSEUDO_011180 [Phytophthora pseudosyringae]